jgi:glycosyltransferase involved in cell wall biosynthesis
LNVGHVADLKGGFCVDSALGPREMKKFDASVSLAFEKHIDELLSDKSLADSLGKDGYQNVLADYNWNEIREKYSDFFNSKKTWLG